MTCERCKQLEKQAYDLLGELKVANLKLSVQPQRTWVGLTDEQIEAKKADWFQPDLKLETIFRRGIRAAEAAHGIK